MGGSHDEIELQSRNNNVSTYSISVTDGETKSAPSSSSSAALTRRTKHASVDNLNKLNNINNYNNNSNNNYNDNIKKEFSFGDDSFNSGELKKRRKRKFGAVVKDFGLGVASNFGVTVDQPDDTPWLHSVLQACGWGVLYWGVAWMSLQFVLADFSSFWPPNGTYASAMLTQNTRGRRIVPFVMLISIFTVNIAWGRTLVQSFGFVGVNTVECLLASSVIRGLARSMSGKKRLNLLHRNDLASILLGTIIGCAISANLGTVLARSQLDPSRSYGDTYIKWLGRNVVGVALIVPLFLSIPPFRVRTIHLTIYNWIRMNKPEVLRAMIMFVSLIVVPAICTWVVSGTTLSSVVALYISCPLILYAGAIYGAFGVSFSVLVVTLTIVTSLLLFGRYHVQPLLTQVSTISWQGEFIWMQLLTFLLISMALVFVMVLTERDRARALIERKVKERTEALTEALREIGVARARAETADADKAVFFSFLCHELRNPLHVVSNMAGFLEEKMKEQELSQIRAIKLSSGYMLALVSDVLDMGRFEAGRVVLENISVDIHNLLQNNFTCAEGLVKMHSLSFETHIEPTVPQYLATDPTRLQQILNNLISNAFKFTPKGGNIKIEVKVANQFSQPAPHKTNEIQSDKQTSPHNNSNNGFSSPLIVSHPVPSPAELSEREIVVGERKERSKLELSGMSSFSDIKSRDENGEELENWVTLQMSVSDTGIGIEADIIDKIFRPYAQATISTVREYGGSGLGLAITNQIVHLMMGKLTVDSEVGKGSTFSITVPMRVTSAPLENHNSVTPTNHALLQSLFTQSLASTPASPVSPHNLIKDRVATEIAFFSSFRDLHSNTGTACMNDVVINDNHRVIIGDNNSNTTVDSTSKTEIDITFTDSSSTDNTIPSNIEKDHNNTIDTTIDINNNNNNNNNDKAKSDNENKNNNTNSANITINIETTKRILVVDDSDMNRMILITMIKKILVKDTFTIDVAVNGLDAVNLVTHPDTLRYDIIFMDINMPVMDGWTACARIQTHGVTSPIIVNTANKISGSDTAEKIQLSGVSGALAKPFSKSDIHELFVKFRIL